MTAASFAGDGSALTNLPAGPLGTSIDSAEIANDTIVDADVNSNAAIAGSKISPNFGAQNVVTTGSVTAGEVKATGYLQASAGAGAPAAGDCDAAAEYGRLRVDTTNNRLYVCSTSGWVLAANNAGTLLATQNLADVGDASIARTNLGLGALATKGSIADGDVSAGAAIAGSKVSPNFGAQNVVTTGSVTAASFAGDGSALTNLPAGPLGTSVDSGEIVNDTIVDADVKTNAAIAGTKISPNFGAQNVVTTGSVTAASFAGDGSALTNLPAGPLGTSVDSGEIVNDTIVDADVKTNAAIAGTKISPDFGAQNVVTTGSVTAASFSGNGSGLTNLPPSGGLTSCPAGFTMIGTSGKRGTFCIDTNQRTDATWHSAKNTCTGLSLAEGAATLCNHNEWYQACMTASPSGMTGDFEWVAEFSDYNNGVLAGSPTCSARSVEAVANANPFRCCVR